MSLSAPRTVTVPHTVPEPSGAHHGRDATPLAFPLLVILGLLSLVAGVDTFVGSSHTKDFFAWGFASPVTAALVGAGLLGVVPMMFTSSVRVLWEELRIAVVPAGVLVCGMLVVSVMHRGELALGGGGVIALVMAWGWLIAMLGLTLFVALVLVNQLREPGFPLARVAPLPQWAVPIIALEGSAFLGLGIGLVVRPDFWGGLVPWEVSDLDARALGVWSLTLGVALLQSLVEADLDRVRPGLVGIIGIGALGLAGLAWYRDEIDWGTWTAPIAVGLLVALLVTGMLGAALRRRALPS